VTSLSGKFQIWRIERKLRRMYTEFLGREPDPEGFAFYSRELMEGTYDFGKIEAIFKASDEYYRHHGLEPPGAQPDLSLRFRRVNLGCGFDRRSDYLNIDIKLSHKPDVVADVRDLSMFPDGCMDEILAQDLLEHLYRYDTESALTEWNRILVDGGVLKLRVPNVIGILDLIRSKEKEDIAEQKKLIQALFGSQVDHSDFHYTGFTESLLRYYLLETGFGEMTFQAKDCWMFDVTARKLKKVRVDGG
jgi:predicted SAM-dependent methyltransferase